MENEPVSLHYLSTYASNQLSQQIKNVTDQINEVPFKFTGPIESILENDLPQNSLVVTDEFGKIAHSSATINQLNHIKTQTPIRTQISYTSNLIHNSSSNFSSNIFLTSDEFITYYSSGQGISSTIIKDMQNFLDIDKENFKTNMMDKIVLENDNGIKLIVDNIYHGDLTVNGDITVENNVLVKGQTYNFEESSTGVFHTDTFQITTDNAIQNHPHIYIDQSGNSNILEIFNNDDQKIVVTKEGYVGIGKTNPEYFIDAASNINVTGNYKVHGNNLSLSDFADAPSEFPPESHTHTTIEDVNGLSSALAGKQEVFSGIVSESVPEIQIDADINLTVGHNFKINGVDLNLSSGDEIKVDTWKTIGDTDTGVEIKVDSVVVPPTQIDDYTYYHAFTTPSAVNTITFTKDTVCDVLVVGGGGSGGYYYGGGGGGGAVIHTKNVIVPEGTYNVTVGEGGSYTSGGGTGRGGDSSVFGAIAKGGAPGEIQEWENHDAKPGLDGGSGSGARLQDSYLNIGLNLLPNPGGQTTITEQDFGDILTTSTYKYIYGNDGGIGIVRTIGYVGSSGGGGGAGEKGYDGYNNDTKTSVPFVGGNGGDGIGINITGNTVYYGAGGGGAGYDINAGNGGMGGGGGGSSGGSGTSGYGGYSDPYNTIKLGQDAIESKAGDGADNTGSGGGGAYWKMASYGLGYTDSQPGDGGSGIVIIKWRVFPQQHVTNNDISVYNDNIVVGKTEFYDNFVEYGNMDGVTDMIVNTSSSLIVSSGDIITQDGSIKTIHGHVETSNLNIKDDLNIKTSIRDYSSNVLTKYPQDHKFYTDTTDMLAWYKFDGDFKDSSGNGQDLTNNGAAIDTVKQKTGTGCLDLTLATNNYVSNTTSYNYGADNGISFSLWFQLKSTLSSGTNTRLFIASPGGGGGKRIIINANGSYIEIVILSNGSETAKSLQSSYSPPINTWIHVSYVLEKNPVSAKFYLNGILYDSTTDIHYPASSASYHTIIGTDYNKAKNNDGYIDDFRIYNRALTPEEVRILYQPKLIEFRVEQSSDFYNDTTDMLAWYKFDGDLTDSSGNGKDLTKVSDSIPVYFDDDAVVGTKSISFSRTADQGLSSTVDLSGGKSFSISLWIYRNTNDETDQFVSTEDIRTAYRRLLISVGSNYSFAFHSSALRTDNYPNDLNQWIHLTCTYHSRARKIYRNGILVANDISGDHTNFGANSLFIGKGDTRICDCKLDDVRIYNRALTPEEITTIYNCSTNYRAFNNNKSLVGWVGETPTIDFDTEYPGQYLKIDLGEYILPKQLTIAPVASEEDNRPKDFRLYGAQILQGVTIYEERTLRQPTNIPGTDYWYYAFTSTSGTNSITFHEDTECDVLVVGGGGGGGSRFGGGGGAGGVSYSINQVFNGTYNITIGDGGNGGITTGGGGTAGAGQGTNGNDSFIEKNSSVLFIGKGGGGGGRGDTGDGSSGGSGGGSAGRFNGTGGTTNQGSTYWNGTTFVAGGYAGGTTYIIPNGTRPYVGGGGGGAGGVGFNTHDSVEANKGKGGTGIQISITGNDTYYAGGGGGGSDVNGTTEFLASGGLGGGGRGGGTSSFTLPTAGTPNTGGGGGGGIVTSVRYNVNIAGAAGGSGIVIIRWTVTNSDKYMLLLDHQTTELTAPSTEVTYPLVSEIPIACRYFTLVVQSTYAESPIATNAKISEMELYGYEQRPFNLTKFPRYAMNANSFDYPDGSGITVRCTGSSVFADFDYWETFDNLTLSDLNGWASSGSTYNTDGSYNSSSSFMGTSGEWIMIDLGEQIVLNNIKIYPRVHSSVLTKHRCPKTFKIYASNDKDDYDNASTATNSQVNPETETYRWEEIYNGNNTTDGSQETPYIYIISHHESYRYYAMVVSKIFESSASKVVDIRELEFWGHVQEYTTDISNKSWKVSQSTVNNDLVFSTSHDNGNSLIPRSSISAETGNGSYTNFTGIHHCKAEKEELYDDKYIGMIVSSTKKYQKLNSIYDKANIQRNMDKSEWDCLPVVTLTSKENDKDVFGIITKIEDVDATQREIQTGFMKHYYDKERFDRRLHIAGVGEGGIWVCDCNGSIESGDYISSSSINGYGMKQSDDIQHNYTVAKATMNCDFNPKILPVKVIATSNIAINIVDEYDSSNIPVSTSNIATSNIPVSTSNVVPVKTEPMFFERIYLRDETGKYIYEELLDDDGNIVYEPEYEIKYINSENNFIDFIEYSSNVESCHKVAFIGCSYHCS